ncbi:MAG: sel1 repeat family protein [Algicola sp.]|nr:sel1 repeat family protein [Algicola sp.]
MYKILMLAVFGLLLSLPATASDKQHKNYFCQTDCTMEFNFFRRYAENGSSMAHLMLAIMYYRGKGTDINIEAGSRHLYRAAEKKEPAAMFQLGYLLMHGVYMEKDLERAKRWLQKAEKFNQVGAKAQLAVLERMQGKYSKQIQISKTAKSFYADYNDQQVNEALSTAKTELCEAASQRKVFEIIALFDEKDVQSTAEMAEKAVSWNMANWQHRDDLAYLDTFGIDFNWDCVRQQFVEQFNSQLDRYHKIDDIEQYRAQHTNFNLLNDSIKRLVNAKVEVERREAQRIKAMSKTQKKAFFERKKDIEVISISAGYSYQQLLYVARNQTCNQNCDPPWYYVVAPLIVLPGFSAKVQ